MFIIMMYLDSNNNMLVRNFAHIRLTLELISLTPLVGTPETDTLAVKLLDNQLYIIFLAF